MRLPWRTARAFTLLGQRRRQLCDSDNAAVIGIVFPDLYRPFVGGAAGVVLVRGIEPFAVLCDAEPVRVLYLLCRFLEFFEGLFTKFLIGE